MELTLDQDVLKKWVGNKAGDSDMLAVGHARQMEATLDRQPVLREDDPLPPLFHWLYFPSAARLSELGRDGHRALGRFLPPVNLPRRMWAGGRLTFEKPLHLGEQIKKQSEIASVEVKQGRSGTLCFVTVRHTLVAHDEACWTEEHDIVYREEHQPGASTPEPEPTPENPDWSREVDPSAVMLFRYSALTFNGHRIHYDADFCRDHEGYPGLVVHGPLIATLLADLAVQATGRTLKSFDFRAKSPLFNTCPFRIEGRQAADGELELWARNPEGGLAMQASARI